MHTCPVVSDLCGVSTVSVVTPGSGQHVQCLEMALVVLVDTPSFSATPVAGVGRAALVT